MAVLTTRGQKSYGPSITGPEQLIWYFFRVSGVVLVGLTFSHMFITHYLHAPSETTFDFVANRYANPLWRTADWLLLLTALWHGLLGTRLSINDYVRSAGQRLLGNAALLVTGLAFTAVGTITILTFDEQAARDNTGPLAGAFWIGDVLGYSLYVIAAITYASVVLLGVWAVNTLRRGGALIYKGDSGQYAWVLHRATGLGIVGFLLVHILDILLIGLGRDVYDHTVEFYGHLFIVPMEVMLVGAVIYHGLNGLRLTLIDFWELGLPRQRQLYYASLVGAVLLTLPSLIVIYQHEFS